MTLEGDAQQQAYRRKKVAPRALLVMNLGVVGVITFVAFVGVILSILALVIAPRARRDIEADRAHLTGESLIMLGRALAIVALVMTGALVLLFISYQLSRDV